MPRRLKLPFDDIVKAIHMRKNTIFNGYEMVVGPTHPIWAEIRQELNGEISEKSLYTKVKCNRNDVLNKINIKCDDVQKYIETEEVELDVEDNNSDFKVEDRLESDIDKIYFKITYSKGEWKAIQCEKKYQSKHSRNLKRNYKILNPGTWTEIVHSHFWEQTKIVCPIVYKRSKIYESGFYYCVFYGKCKACNSELKGTLDAIPPINNRAIFHCSY